MLVTAGLAAFTSHFSTFIPEPLMQAASFVVSFAVVSALFTLMFKWLPDAAVDSATGSAIKARRSMGRLVGCSTGGLPPGIEPLALARYLR